MASLGVIVMRLFSLRLTEKAERQQKFANDALAKKAGKNDEKEPRSEQIFHHHTRSSRIEL
jgi:hypothetical protein